MKMIYKWFWDSWYQFLLGMLVGAVLLAFTIRSVEAKPYYHSCEYKERQTSYSALACNIYFESRSEGTMGMLAVGHVTLNRLDTNRYPNSIVDVVYQSDQFSWTNDGKSDRVQDIISWRKSLRLSKYLLDTNQLTRKVTDITTGSLFYHTINVSPSWASINNVVIMIGDHIFYKVDIKR